MNKAAGFSLVEVMVATLITALLATMGLLLLSNALRAQDQLEATLDAVQELELARAVIKADLAQISPRTYRNEFGETTPLTFEGGADLRNERLMVFVRNGREAVGRASSVSSLQYVEYAFENKSLIRKSRLYPDAATDEDLHARVLIADVENVQIRFLTRGGWTDIWTLPATSGRVSAPVAVSLDVHHPRYGRLESLFLTNAGT